MGDREAVRRAVEGAECVFGVSLSLRFSSHDALFYSRRGRGLIPGSKVTVPFTPIPEIQQGKNMVDAAKEAGVKFFVWR